MRAYLDGRTLDDVAIARLCEFEPQAIAKHPNGYYLAYSGGKDSDVILDLARRAGVKFEGVHNLTTCDPPEVIYHVRTQPDVRIDKPKMTMWQLIRKKKMGPLRNARFCCEVMKERGGIGRIVVTGVRWGESNRRSKRSMMEVCYRQKSRHFLHPIIDWSTAAVWEYIRERGLPYCSLYDEGQKRVGCVLCPMTRDVERQMKRWPRLCKAWEKAIKATFTEDKVGGPNAFQTPEEYWQWWLDRDAPSRKDDQPVLFEDDPGAVDCPAPPAVRVAR